MTCDGDRCTFGKQKQPCGNMREGSFSLACTLPKGHSGDHVACSLSEHGISSWGKAQDQSLSEYVS